MRNTQCVIQSIQSHFSNEQAWKDAFRPGILIHYHRKKQLKLEIELILNNTTKRDLDSIC